MRLQELLKRHGITAVEGFSLGDLMQELGRLELAALGWVKHGDVPEHA
jgi:hypothetical protein